MDATTLFLQQLVEMPKALLQQKCLHEIVQTKDHTLYPFLYGPYALMMTEPEPENDIHIVFDCFVKLNQYPIVALGNFKSNAYGQALLEKYSNNNLIKLIELPLQERTINMLRSNCFIYIDAHHFVNQTTSLIEAMFMQLPIIAFASIYNQLATDQKALYYKRAHDLLEILQTLHPTRTANFGSAMKKTLTDQMERFHLVH